MLTKRCLRMLWIAEPVPALVESVLSPAVPTLAQAQAVLGCEQIDAIALAAPPEALAWVAAVRAERPTLQIVWIVEGDVRPILNRAYALDVTVLVRPLDPEHLLAVCARVKAQFDASIDAIVGSERLTPRERACLSRVVARQAYREAAEALGIGIPSVRTYLQRALARLGAGSMEQVRAALLPAPARIAS